MVRALARDRKVASSTPGQSLPSNNSGPVVHNPCASVTKQYNLVPSAGGKVTVGLASHWPCITDSVVYPPTAQRPMSWR